MAMLDDSQPEVCGMVWAVSFQGVLATRLDFVRSEVYVLQQPRASTQVALALLWQFQFFRTRLA